MEEAKITTTPEGPSKEEVLEALRLIEKFVDNIVESGRVHWETALYAYLRVTWVAVSTAIAHIDEYEQLPDDDFNDVN